MIMLRQNPAEVQLEPADFLDSPPARSEEPLPSYRWPREMLVEHLGAEKAAEYRRRAEARERLHARLRHSGAETAYGFDASVWAARIDGSTCRPRRPTATAPQARRRRRGRRLAQVLREYAPWIMPELLEHLAEPIGQLVGEIVEARRVRS